MRFLGAILTIVVWADGQTVPVPPSPVEARIAVAQANLKAKPASASLYNELVFALCRKGRDREDPAVYKEAEKALQHSLQLARENYEARKLQVAILLGEHDYTHALQLAKELNRKVPDDLAGWAALSEINIALGSYSDAEKQAQWVLDLRPGNPLGFEKAAALREIFGDLPGAIEFVDEANRRTPINDVDQRAWLLTEKSRLQLAAGYKKEAEGTVQQALLLFPDSQRASGVLAHIQLEEGRNAESAALLQKRYEAVKTATNLYAWAGAVQDAGEASALFDRFEAQALAESATPFNANLQLAFFYLNQKKNPRAALALTTKMVEERKDSATVDAYAWALFQNGRYAEAKAQMDRALAAGVQDVTFASHAAQITAKLATSESR